MKTIEHVVSTPDGSLTDAVRSSLRFQILDMMSRKNLGDQMTAERILDLAKKFADFVLDA